VATPGDEETSHLPEFGLPHCMVAAFGLCFCFVLSSELLIADLVGFVLTFVGREQMLLYTV
jgi:hypothetical protein